jgi:inner membrane protein
LLGASVIVALRPPHSTGRGYQPLLLGAFLGICPDFDYLLNHWPGLGRGWHHGFTHSVAFAFLIGLLASWVYGRGNVRDTLTYGLATLSHPLLDFLFTESRGIELLWPFTTRRFKLRLPNPIDYSWRTASWSETSIDLLKICLIELALFAPIFLLVWLVKRTRSRRAASFKSEAST